MHAMRHILSVSKALRATLLLGRPWAQAITQHRCAARLKPHEANAQLHSSIDKSWRIYRQSFAPRETELFPLWTTVYGTASGV